MIVEGKFLRQRNSGGYVARVKMAIEESTTVTEVRVAWMSVDLNEASPSLANYEDWKQGAMIGINYALRKMNLVKQYAISVIEIIGQDVDTNPTIVAAAAIDGVWKGMNYTPTQTEWESIEEVVYKSWQKPHFHLPTEFTKE